MMNHLEPKSIHRIFADNLRAQCARFESIAALCRACDINRQQFNRYLSGQNLPNPRTLKRLCEVLLLPETALFAVLDPSVPATKADGLRRATPSPFGQHGLVSALTHVGANRPTTSMKSGFYHCYAPLAGYPRYLMRMLISVNNTGSTAHFCRRTAYSQPHSRGRPTVIGKHRGSILSDVHACLFLGMNTIHPFEFSILKVAHSMSEGATLMTGLAVLRIPDNDMACNIVLEWAGDTVSDAKAALRNIGIIALDDPSLQPEIIVTLTRSTVDRKQPILLLIQDMVANFMQEANSTPFSV